jgi:hypothetical protein
VLGDEAKALKPKRASLFGDEVKKGSANATATEAGVDDKPSEPGAFEKICNFVFDFALTHEHGHPKWFSGVVEGEPCEVERLQIGSVPAAVEEALAVLVERRVRVEVPPFGILQGRKSVSGNGK